MIHFPSFDQTEGIPDFVAEITSLLAELVVIHDVIAGRSGEHKTHAHTVGAILRDKVERVRRVAERLRHLASDRVTDDTGEVNVIKRLLAYVFITGHNHTRNPEEDDVRAGDECGGGVVVVDFFVARLKDTVEEGDRPEPAGEPCVECVRILFEI